MTTLYTKEELDTVISLCRAAAERLTESADARHLCERQMVDDDVNSTHAFGKDARDLAQSAVKILFDVRTAAYALILGVDASYFDPWSTPDRLRRLYKVTDLARAQAGGSSSVDWGHAAELRFFADTLSRCAWTPEDPAVAIKKGGPS